METAVLSSATPATTRVSVRPSPNRGLLQRCGDHPCRPGGCHQAEEQRWQAMGPGPREAPSIVRNVLVSPGRPLEHDVRAVMEAGLGHDFSAVRVHADSDAAKSAQAVDALAYTVGSHVVFGAGAYRPDAEEGRRLLVHELTHVVQQTGVVSVPEALTVGPADDPAEREAAAVARALPVSVPVQPRSAIADDVMGSSGRPRSELSRIRTSSTDSHLQRQASKPTIPIPVFDELDPSVSVPDIPGIPGFLRGQTVRLSDVKKGLDLLRGGKPENKANCDPAIGFERAGSGQFKGLCCRGPMRSKENCCQLSEIALLDNRCCTGLEVNVQNKCVKLQVVPPGPLPPKQPSGEKPPPAAPTPQAPALAPPSVVIHFQLDKPAAGSTTSALPGSFAAGGQAAFAGVLAQLKANPALHVQLIGRASPEGTPEYNVELGARRASLVADALVEGGVSAAQISDPPASDLRKECQPVRQGVVTCGQAGSTGPGDRQVLGRFSLPGEKP